MRALLLLVTVVTSAASQQPATWRLTEEWRVGGEVEGPHSLLDVRAMDVLPGGRIVLFDAKDQQVHILGPNGQPVRTVGRKGAGPGEFERANGLAVSPRGDIIVNDPSTNRFTLLSSGGDLVRTVPITDRWGFGYTWDAFFNTNGQLDEFASVRKPGEQQSTPVRRVWSADLARSDTVFMAECSNRPKPDPEATTYSFRNARGGQMMTVPFLQPAKPGLVAADGSTWVGQFPRFDVIERIPRGGCNAEATIRLTGARIPVPTALRDSQVDRIREAAARYGAPSPDVSKIPQTYPPFEALHLDKTGQLWVERRSGANSRRFEVYSSGGELVANVTTPAVFLGYRPVVITSERVLAFIADEDGVTYLASFRIQRT